MGQYSSFNSNNLENRLVKAEQEILRLKAIQNYDPQQIKYTYRSNTLSIDSYRVFPNDSNNHGVIATLLFTSYFPNIFPRVSLTWSGDAVQLSNRYEYASKNAVRIMIYFMDSVIPMSAPDPFTLSLVAESNVSGKLELERTYTVG